MILDDAQQVPDAADVLASTEPTAVDDDFPRGMLASPTRIQL